jgi:hypothetical protein
MHRNLSNLPHKGQGYRSTIILISKIDQLITNQRIPFEVAVGILRYSLLFTVREMKVLVPTMSLLLAAALASSAQVHSTPIAINGRVPLGIESFRLHPANQDFYLIASAENPMFAGMRRVTDGEHEKLVGGNGKPVTFYPEWVQFRLTASSREKIIDDKPFATESNLPLEDLFVNLHFRMKIFHGLEYRYIHPSYVEDVGMPRSVPYNERIYRIGFQIGKVPIEDRVVMEVFSPSGERLCKFHLDLL